QVWLYPGGGGAPRLQRLEEADELLLLKRCQRLEGVAAGRCLTGVAQYHLVQGEGLRAAVRGRTRRAAVVHELVVRPQAPQRRSPNHVSGCLPVGLYYPVASADVVEQEVAERVDDLVAERVGHGELPAVDDRADGRGRDRADVADRATERVEERRAGVGRVVRDEHAVAVGCLGRAHEARERLHVLA